MRVQKIFFLTVLVLTELNFGYVNAADNTNWQADKTLVPNVIGRDCQKAWNILWPQVKRSNLEAVDMLLFYVAWGELSMPGATDNVSRKRDMTILAVHSSSYQVEKSRDTKQKIFSSKELEGMGGKNFLSCLNKTPLQNCAQLAVKNKLVPSLTDYTQQVDALISKGYRVSCSQQDY